MKTFSLHLQSITQYEHLQNIISFVSEDNSGKFGIMPNHYRMMTHIKFGLNKINYENSTTEYLALAGGIIYFIDNTLYISTKRYLRGANYNEMVAVLDKQLRSEASSTLEISETLNRLDETILERLWVMEQKGRL